MTNSSQKSGRKLALLGGTTTIGDCAVALGYLLTPWRLVRGRSVARFEKLFAETVGTRHGISFNAARVGFFGLLKVLDIGEGDEVLLQVPTHIVVPNR
jgi:dTDP-4-amino-4,6-dideoxygalactose transaminase